METGPAMETPKLRTDTMIERVAWALMGALPPDAGHDESIRAARAAIEAMRNPTDEIMTALENEICTFDREHDFASEYAGAAWANAIDAALSEPGS